MRKFEGKGKRGGHKHTEAKLLKSKERKGK